MENESPIPEIYVLWHPNCPLGEVLAKRIYAWLRPGSGLGPKVFYRSLPSPIAPAGGLPLSLPGEQREPLSINSRYSNTQIVLILIDAHMIADASWRYWIHSLASPPVSGFKRLFLPVALDSSAYNITAPLRAMNFLRPAGLPVPDIANLTERIILSLLKQLTESMCRIMLINRVTPIDGIYRESKINVFLSHAKADGTSPAKRIRDYIYSQTQLAAFYDENDIPFGSNFAGALVNGLQSVDTAALIAVRSTRYASRPWCRRELSLFRTPLQEVFSGSNQHSNQHWRLNPVVVVDALEEGSRTQGIPELGSTPMIRWSETGNQEEEIVTTLLRDVLLSVFHSALGKKIKDGAGQIVLNWVPDPTTLLQIPSIRQNDTTKVLYPGRGLSALELDIFDDYFPNAEFQSFEEVLS